MATNNLQTDVWIETTEPIANLETWQWSFQLTPHPSFTLKTDLWVPEFYNFSSALYLQNIFMTGAALGNVQLMNAGKSDDSEPIYYELETQDLEFTARGIIKAISDKLGVVAQYASGSNIEIIPGNEDPIPINIGMGKRVNVATLPNIKSYYITLRWSGEATEKSPVLEGFYLNNIESDGTHEAN